MHISRSVGLDLGLIFHPEPPSECILKNHSCQEAFLPHFLLYHHSMSISVPLSIKKWGSFLSWTAIKEVCYSIVLILSCLLLLHPPPHQLVNHARAEHHFISQYMPALGHFASKLVLSIYTGKAWPKSCEVPKVRVRINFLFKKYILYIHL